VTAAAVVAGLGVCLIYSAVDLPALCVRAAHRLANRRTGSTR
jgi:hypothetical protein